MRKLRIILIFSFLLLLGLLIFSESQTMTVLVKETQARSKPSYLGKVLALIKYGEKIQTGELQKSWYKVVLPDGSGDAWVHSSALTKKQVLMNAGDSDVEKYASSDDVVLAGKGFNKQVEDNYKKETNLDFTRIDEMEQYVISVEEMEDFLIEGELIGVEEAE